MWSMLGGDAANRSEKPGPSRRNPSRDRRANATAPPQLSETLVTSFAKGSQSAVVRWGIGILTIVSLLGFIMYYRAYSHYSEEQHAVIEMVSVSPEVVETPPPSVVVDGLAAVVPQTENLD
eukprot:374174-Amphidinium_carterae.1